MLIIVLHSQDLGTGVASNRFSETGPVAGLVAVFLVSCQDMSVSCVKKKEGIVPMYR